MGKQRCAHLVQAGERELRFRLDPDRDLHAEPRGAGDVAGVIEQRRLTDACFAAHDERSAVPRPRAGDKLLDRFAFGMPAEKVGHGWLPSGGRHRTR